MTWDADLYLRFADARTRPAVELAARVPVPDPKQVIDLGCGPGNSTEVLRHRWPAARICDLDSSPEMIAAARRDYPRHDWVLGRLEEWAPDTPFDVVFSNAAMQWARDHASLVRRLFGHVAGGGALAFQMPSRAYSQVGALIHDVADDPAWRARMDAARTELTIEAAIVYYDVLAPLARSVDMWETEYSHVMDGPGAIVEWIRSTGLRPFLGALESERERERFVGMLTERVIDAYPRRADGRVLFPFRRLFVVALK